MWHLNPVGVSLLAMAFLRSLPPASRAATGRCTTEDFDLAFDLGARWCRRRRARRQGARPSAGVVEGDERQEAAKAVRARDGPSWRAPGTAPESREVRRTPACRNGFAYFPRKESRSPVRGETLTPNHRKNGYTPDSKVTQRRGASNKPLPRGAWERSAIFMAYAAGDSLSLTRQ